MEGTGLKSALETVHAHVTVGHMFTGKAYSRAVRGHLLCASAIQSLVLEEFWDILGPDDRLELQKYYESDDLSKFESEELAIRLTAWTDEKCCKLSESSRTAALWLNYIKYICVVQEFIRAERTNYWNFHVLATKSMLNLFAATGHNNYSESCRLYLQSLSELERNHPEVYNEFLRGDHTVRRTMKNWAGTWTDLSIEQILMKSLQRMSCVYGQKLCTDAQKLRKQ